jgi:acetyl/propionyl-CoA carboxylase alpha subunit
MELLNKLLVANRGEIALRIIRSAKLLGIPTVAIYPESEKESGYVQLADEKVSLGEDCLNATYLNISRIIGIALSTGSTAIHPGYGFLSENHDFALACQENRIIFAGPEPGVLRLMGNKPDAKKLAKSLGIPVVTGIRTDDLTDLEGLEIAYPVMIKASFGGGGKGMKIVSNPEELSTWLRRSSRAALEYFGNGELFVEQYIPGARHVEVQIIGDAYGNIVHLYERECSIQRNHQKIVEEAPAIFLSSELRGKLLADAVRIGKATGYTGAGTVEFLVDKGGNYFFMEMNPRIQVEHAVTEEITGIDIVSEQLKIASGFPVSFSQDQVVITGHAIEVRIYAEDPAKEFRPSSQPVISVNLPRHKNTRIEADMKVSRDTMNNFDPLLLKLIAKGENRGEALNVLRDSMKDLNIIGPDTNTAYLERILCHPLYQQNNLSVEFCRNHHRELTSYQERGADPGLLPYLTGLSIVKSYLEKENDSDTDPWKYIGYWRITMPAIPVTVDGETYRVSLTSPDRSMPAFRLNGVENKIESIVRSGDCIEMTINGVTRKMNYHVSDAGETRLCCGNMQHRISLPNLLKNYPESGMRQVHGTVSESSEVLSPLHGKILDICIQENQLIKKGDPLLVIEAMKTENHILSHKDARVKKISVKVGAQVTDRMPLIILEE